MNNHSKSMSDVIVLYYKNSYLVRNHQELTKVNIFSKFPTNTKLNESE